MTAFYFHPESDVLSLRNTRGVLIHFARYKGAWYEVTASGATNDYISWREATYSEHGILQDIAARREHGFPPRRLQP